MNRGRETRRKKWGRRKDIIEGKKKEIEKEEIKKGCMKEGWIRKDGGWECKEGVRKAGGKGVAGREEEERRKGGCWEQ